MATKFEDIPPELLMALVSSVDPSSWKALRLVNKALAAHVTPLIFRDIEVWIQTQNLSRLQSIALSNNVAPHVRTLTITNDYLPTQILHPRSMVAAVYQGLLNPRGTSRGPSWIDSVAAQDVSISSFAGSDIPEPLKSLGWDRERIFRTWTMQKELAMEQDELIKNSHDVEYLAGALGLLANLSCVKLTSRGIGGPRKMSFNNRQNVFFPGPATRNDGRQLISLFKAAAKASTSYLNRHAKLTTFIMDKDFWDGEYQGHRWLSGRFEKAPPDFGSLDPNTLTAALPIFGTLTNLGLQAQYRKDVDRYGPIIEQNLTALFSGMPDLKDLTLYNPPRVGLLRMHAPIQSITSTSIRTLKLQSCVLHLQGMEDFIQKQAQTLKNLHLENVALESGHLVELFTSIRNHLSLEVFSLKGWLVEVEDDTLLYFKNEESNRNTFLQVKGRRNTAREAIESFVRRRTDLFPAALLDTDSSGFTDFSRGPWGGMTVVLGASQLLDSNQVDF